jgi:hypothetical protein
VRRLVCPTLSPVRGQERRWSGRQFLENPAFGFDREQQCDEAAQQHNCRKGPEHIPDAEIADDDADHYRANRRSRSQAAQCAVPSARYLSTWVDRINNVSSVSLKNGIRAAAAIHPLDKLTVVNFSEGPRSDGQASSG